MSDKAHAPRALVTRLRSLAQWRRIRSKCQRYEVDDGSEPEFVYDVRAQDNLLDDVIYFWGRDGWEEGFWHAKMTIEEDGDHWIMMAEQGTDDRVASLLAVCNQVRAFIQDCMIATEKT